MKFKRKIAPEIKPRQNFITKKRLREDQINFDKLRSYRLDRVKKELEKNNLEACILFDPVNVRYALDTVNMSIHNMHNLNRYCFVPVKGPIILYEYFNCEKLSEHFKRFKKDKHSTMGLAKSVNKRKKLLNYLKRKKPDSYNKVIKQLNLRK